MTGEQTDGAAEPPEESLEELVGDDLARRAIRTIETADGSIKQLSDDLHRSNRLTFWALVGVGAVVVLLAVFLYAIWDDSQDDERTREQARYAACVGYNVEQEGDRLGAKKAVLAFARDAANLTTAERAVYDRYAAEINAANAYRDCSPEGIRNDREHPPDDPAINPQDDPLALLPPTSTTTAP